MEAEKSLMLQMKLTPVRNVKNLYTTKLIYFSDRQWIHVRTLGVSTFYSTVLNCRGGGGFPTIFKMGCGQNKITLWNVGNLALKWERGSLIK